MSEHTRFVPAGDGVEIWSRSVGSGGPTVLLLAGAAMSSRIWAMGMESALVEAGLTVLSFDWRDTGRSTWRRFRDHPYSFDRLVGDAADVTDAWSTGPCAVVGYSMGGCVAQLLALQRSDLVVSVALVSSGYASLIRVDADDRQRALWQALSERDDSSSEAVAASLLRQWNVLHGGGVVDDHARWQHAIAEWIAWGYNARCPHVKLGPQVFGTDRDAALGEIDAPALVVHGDDDPMFPLEHGRALARRLPRAELTIMPGHGHELFAAQSVHERVAAHVLRCAG